MSSLYSGIDAYPTAITLPSDGDMKTAASVNVALQGLMNGLAYFKSLHLGGHGAGILLNPIIKGGATYVENGAGLARRHYFVDVDVRFDPDTAFDIDGPASTSPTITVDRNVNWPTGNHTYGGGSGQTVSFACPTDFSQPMSPVGQGRLRVRRTYTTAGDFDRSINVGSTDLYIIRLGDISAGNKGLVQNGTADGSVTCFDCLWIISYNSVGMPLFEQDGTTAIRDPNNTPIVLINSPTPSAGEYASVRLVWSGSHWEFAGR